jgi:hypothetical protein
MRDVILCRAISYLTKQSSCNKFENYAEQKKL